MRKQKLLVLLAVICLIALLVPVTVSAAWQQDGDCWYYYDEQGNPASDFLQIDGTWYYFWSDGRMAQDTYVWSEDYEGWYAISADGKAHKRLEDGWNLAYGKWYYMENGDVVSYAVKQINGTWYAFDGDGHMLDDEAAWVGSGYYRARVGGALYTNSWYQDGEIWYYYLEDGKAAEDFVWVNGTWYYFWSDGQMVCDEVVYSYVDQAWFALNEDGDKYQRLNKGWTQAFGSWYYLEETAEHQSGLYPVQDGLREIDGVDYYFHWTGKMAANEAVDVYTGEGWRWLVANANGILSTSGWYMEGNYWRYIDEGELLYDGVYEINGKLYGFDGHDLYTVGGEQEIGFYDGDYWTYGEFYVTNGSGELYRNRWRYREITDQDDIGWVYYGDDGMMVTDDALKIDGTWYAFDYNGVMLENEVFVDDEGIYVLAAGGAGTKLDANKWYKFGNIWYYTDAEGRPAQGAMTVSGVTYHFSNGCMAEYDWWYTEVGGVFGYYLFGEEGALVTKSGWTSMLGSWYYVQADGTLAEGWLYDGGQWYYLSPSMRHDQVFYDYDEGKNYYANGKGVCTAVYGNGLTWINGELYYFENDMVVSGTWKHVGGSWYYFGYDGCAYTSCTEWIENAYYGFDQNGKMQTGWFYQSGWYYAESSGALATGLKTIGGAEYLFSDWGEMRSDGSFEYEDAVYIIGSNGVIRSSLKNNSWTQVDGKWYYCSDGQLYRDVVREINGEYYGFDDNGVMLSGGIHYTYSDYYYFSSNGEILTGWHKVDGQWVYAEADSDPQLCRDFAYVNGKEYVFDDDCYLMIGSFTRYGWAYVTDDDGAVIKSTELADGWNHYNGNWYYTQNKSDYNGWLGDYYIDRGRMLYYQCVEYNGQWYFLKANGLCARNGWAQIYDNWVLARADGSLYCSTWAQQGRDWYYFNGYTMVSDGILEIDGKYHEFAEDGRWLGEVDIALGDDITVDVPLGLEDGTWYQHSRTGKWYYYHGGYPVAGSYYINGSYYFFDYITGEMVSNGFGIVEYSDYDYKYLGSRYYYGADGAAVKYTGWQMIRGQWYFFGDDNRFRTGLLKDSIGYYYAYWDYEDGYSMVTNDWRYVNGELYWFNGSGLSTGAISGSGWRQLGGEWFYLEDGALIDGYREIGGVGYYFDDGLMVTENLRYVNGAERFFDASGAMVTKQGWYKVFGEDWIYVGARGNVYSDGIYFIDGVEYTFRNGIWVS